MIFYNKAVMTAAGLDAENPPLATYDEFLATSKKIVPSGRRSMRSTRRRAASSSSPGSTSIRCTRRRPRASNWWRTARRSSTVPEGLAVNNFWAQIYTDKLAGNEAYNGDSFADGKAAGGGRVRPWAISVYDGKVDWGVVPVPTSTGMPADQINTFSDPDVRDVYLRADPGHGLGFLRSFSTTARTGRSVSCHPDRQLPRQPRHHADRLCDTCSTEPLAYTLLFAEQAARGVEVPNVPNSVEIWQTFRDAYSSSVIFGKTDVPTAMSAAATAINGLAKAP